jgi:glycosyltransferase involved in cell wall biosynthesis
MIVVYVIDFPLHVEFDRGNPLVTVHAESINWTWELYEAEGLSEYCRIVTTSPFQPPPHCKPDVVFAGCDSVAIHAAKLAKDYNCPLVIEVISKVPEYKEPGGWDEVREILRNANALIGISPDVVISLKNYNDHLHYIPHGVNDKIADPVLFFTENKRDGFVAVSRLLEHKRFEVLIEAFCRLNLYNLTIIGDGEERESLEGINKILLEPARFMGAVDDATKFRTMAKSKALLSASKGEQFFISAVESLYCITPCVLYELDTLVNIYGSAHGSIFYFKTMDELMDLINKFNQMDDEEIIEIGKRGRKWVVEHGMTLTQRSKRVFEVLKNVV